MIDWNEIKEKIESISIVKTFKKHLDQPKRTAIHAHIRQIRKIHEVYTGLLGKTPWRSISPSEESFLIITHILFLTEGLLSFGMNIVIYALMLKEHHDIWSGRERKFVCSYDELSEVPLYVRLKFLEKHKFGFFSEICPKDIRNAIAHLNFNIDSNGTIHLKNPPKKYTKEELADKIHDAVEMVNLLDGALAS